VIDGPFTESKELVAGYWILQVKSLEEAVEWVKRIPNPDNEEGEVEIRPLYEMEDFTTASNETVARNVELQKQLSRS
jgi:hypothetical protein